MGSVCAPLDEQRVGVKEGEASRNRDRPIQERTSMAEEEELVDYEEEEELAQEKQGKSAEAAGDKKDGAGKKGMVQIHSSGFKDFLLKPELLRAIVDCGFEHPSEVQHECIPQAILGMDVVCQAKSGMGKTAVFVLAVLQQVDPKPNEVAVLVLAHTRELAVQIKDEFTRFTKYLPDVKTEVIYGGKPISEHVELFKNNCPHIVCGTPGRVK